MPERPSESELIYDWNEADGEGLRPAFPHIELDDETLRDGLQSPSVRTPAIEDKLRMVHYMAELGIDGADIGLPAAGPAVVEDVTRIVQEIVDNKLAIQPNCAARTLEADIQPIADISQKTGVAIEVACFLGSSPIRQYTEAWEIDRLVRLTEDAVSFSVRNGLPVLYVTEDTTRAKPDDLRRLYTAAVEAGAKRVCVADTVGHATPRGTANVVRFIKEVVDATGEDVKVDWHGHRDRGLDIMNALVAAQAGAARLHGTMLGIGERVGNTALDLLLVNMKLLGWTQRDLRCLPDYCELVARTTGVPMPENYPVVGRDAFRTATGVHAAAIIKARDKGDNWLADRVYSSVPASYVGRGQVIEVGPMSGESNVVYWLRQRGLDTDPTIVRRIFDHAKQATAVLEEREILELYEAQRSSREISAN